jgi:hypothetical protein
MQLITGILVNTPIWVWLILAALIYLGLRLTRTRETSAAGILLTSSIFLLIAVGKLIVGHIAATTVLGTVSGIVAASILLLVVRPGKYATGLASGKILIQGEWFSLVLIMSIFLVNYGIAVASALSPELAMSENIRFTSGFINALSSGFMVGRAYLYLRGAKR